MFQYDSTTRSVLAFEFAAQKIWPRLPQSTRDVVAKRCTQCVISEKVPGVVLDNGICNHCIEFNNLVENQAEKAWEEKYIENQKRDLHRLLTEYQGKGEGRFDALIPFSGGKDSTYMVYRIKRDYPGLRILAMTWDNGFYSPIALQTAVAAANKLDLDYIVYKPRSSVYKSLYRYTLTHVNESGSYGTVDRLDGTLNQHLGLRFAAEMKIPLMISGVDWAQALCMGSNTHFDHSYDDLKGRIDTDRVERRSGLKLADIFSPEDLDLYWDGTKWPLERVPRFILPFIAWRPDKREVTQILTEKGLMNKAHTSPIVTNNQVLSVMTAIDIVKLGYCTFEPEFADMVRFKSQDPVYWRNVFEFAEYIVRKGWYANKGFKDILKRLELSFEDVGLR